MYWKRCVAVGDRGQARGDGIQVLNNFHTLYLLLTLSTWGVQCRRDLKAFFTPMHELSRFLEEELIESLGLSRDAFTRLELSESNSNCTGRMKHYPLCPEPDAILGIPSHGDMQMMAILYQDDMGGLQVLKDGQ